jgi:hypothetical protein
MDAGMPVHDLFIQYLMLHCFWKNLSSLTVIQEAAKLFYSVQHSKKLGVNKSAALHGSTYRVIILSELYHSVIFCQNCNACAAKPLSSYSCTKSELTHSDKQY